MTTATSVRDPIPHTCVNCHRQLGIAVGVIPHFIKDGGGELGPDEGKTEAWCPVCFVKVRAHRETMDHGGPRFAADFSTGHRHPVHGRTPAMMRAIKCANPKCGVESLAHGHLGCLQCGSRIFVVLTDSHYAAIVAGAKNVLAGQPKPGEAPGSPLTPQGK
jgi:hypothetical protein